MYSLEPSMRLNLLNPVLFATISLLSVVSSSSAGMITFQASDFSLNPTFSNVTIFNFSIDLVDQIGTGVYSNPTINSITYNVSGSLAPGTPSGFPAFALSRTITGPDFYAQGSSLNFEIDAAADLSDGIQFNELVGSFIFNGREVGTGRYHPSYVEFNPGGTGTIMNSNNFGGINPSSMQMVDVNFGEEYITELSFAPTQTLVDFESTTAAVPEPSTMSLLGLLGVGVAVRRRNRSRQHS
jgi:hypothetical protein